MRLATQNNQLTNVNGAPQQRGKEQTNCAEKNPEDKQ